MTAMVVGSATAGVHMSFVPVGGKTLGIQIATSGKARLLRTLFGVILGLMRLNFYPYASLSLVQRGMSPNGYFLTFLKGWVGYFYVNRGAE